MKKLLLALLLTLLWIGSAAAQCNGVVPNNTVCGNATGGTNTMRPTSTSVLTGVPGGSNGQIQYNNSGAFGGFTAGGDLTFSVPNFTISSGAVTNSKLAVGGANTIKGSLNGTTTIDEAIPACATDGIHALTYTSGTGWSCTVLTTGLTRTTAASTNLTANTAITTLGYSTLGDGGAATYIKTSSPFIDTNIATGTISNTGTSGCTNGTYFGVQFSGGTGNLFEATVVVSGNVVTSITQTGVSPAYSVSDVLSASPNITGCSTQVTFTVSTLSTPTCSFTDSASNKWQILMPAVGLDPRACGVKFDWTQTGGDAGATDNFTTMSNALNFAAYQSGGIPDTGGGKGGLILLPRDNAMMICGGNGAKALQIPYGVTVRGQGGYVSRIKICDAWGTSTNFIEICNSQSHLSCFSAGLDSLQIFTAATHDVGGGVSGLNAIYNNNCQQPGCGIRNVIIYQGACRRGFTFETGYGGASIVDAIEHVEVKGGQKQANCGGVANVQGLINYGTTQVLVTDLTVSGQSPSAGPRDLGLQINGGFVLVHHFYGENVVTPLQVNIQTSLANGQVRVMGADAGASCGWMLTLVSTNFPSNLILSPPTALNACSSGMVLNGESGGTNQTNPNTTDTTYPGGAPHTW